MTENVCFLLNGQHVYFEESVDVCVELLRDDEFAIDYIGRAIRGNRLSHIGITVHNIENVDIVRPDEQPHAPEAVARVTAKSDAVISDPCFEGKKQPYASEVVVQASAQTDAVVSDPSIQGPSKIPENVVCVWQPYKKQTPQDNEAALLLLKLRGSEEYKKWFSDKKHNKMMLWGQIASELMKKGYKIGNSKAEAAEKCRQKFANLQRNYIVFIDNTKKTGSEYLPKPQFFDELHEILGSKDKVLPQYLVDSSDPNIVTRIEDSQNENFNVEPEVEPVPSTSYTQRETKRGPVSKTTSHKVTATESIKPPKNTVMEKLKEIQECQNKKMDTFMNIILDSVQKQNTLLEAQIRQREEFLKIFKHILQSNKKKRKRKSDSSSDSDM